MLPNPEKVGYRAAIFNGITLASGAIAVGLGSSQESLYVSIVTTFQVLGGSAGLVMLWGGFELRRAHQSFQEIQNVQGGAAVAPRSLSAQDGVSGSH